MSTPDPVDIAKNTLAVENEQLKIVNTGLKTELDAVKKALTEANKYIEDQQRALMFPTLKANTKLSDDELRAMDTATMKQMFDTVKVIKTPYAGIKGFFGGDDLQPESRLTVPPKYRYGRKEAK